MRADLFSVDMFRCVVRIIKAYDYEVLEVYMQKRRLGSTYSVRPTGKASTHAVPFTLFEDGKKIGIFSLDVVRSLRVVTSTW
jgi:hypothetical protein